MEYKIKTREDRLKDEIEAACKRYMTLNKYECKDVKVAITLKTSPDKLDIDFRSK